MAFGEGITTKDTKIHEENPFVFLSISKWKLLLLYGAVHAFGIESAGMSAAAVDDLEYLRGGACN